jgi:hypothetical protein
LAAVRLCFARDRADTSKMKLIIRAVELFKAIKGTKSREFFFNLLLIETKSINLSVFATGF